MRLTELTPILYASDFARTVACFVEQLGFEKLWDWGAPPSFGAVKRDTIEIFVSQGAQGAPGTWMAINVDDVDELHDEIAARGARIVHGPANEPWGMREMRVELPDGHVIRFGHGIPTAPERIVERRPISARLERGLAAVVEELAESSGMTIGQLLEDVLLHSFERLNGGEASPTAYTARTHRLIETLKVKHGVDYRAHASYGFVEKKDG